MYVAVTDLQYLHKAKLIFLFKFNFKIRFKFNSYFYVLRKLLACVVCGMHHMVSEQSVNHAAWD